MSGRRLPAPGGLSHAQQLDGAGASGALLMFELEDLALSIKRLTFWISEVSCFSMRGRG